VSVVCSPAGVRGGIPAAKRFSCILEAPDGLSWNLLRAQFGGMVHWLPINPPMGLELLATAKFIEEEQSIVVKGSRVL